MQQQSRTSLEPRDHHHNFLHDRAMHGVKRRTAEQRAAKRAANEEKAAKYRAISRAAMERKAARVYDQESLDVAATVVRANPDFGTVWNFRREVLQHLHSEDHAAPAPESAEHAKADSSVVGDDAIVVARRAACETELELTKECLAINPKSYPVWHHRQWILQWGRCAWQYEREIGLTSKLLALDDRNFHCWTHRRFVARVARVPAAAELAFTGSKIEANFSNYSAWHFRSKLLPVTAAAPSAEGGAGGGSAAPADADASSRLGEAVRRDLLLVRDAFFTAPEDSSAWFYHRWLLAALEPGRGAAAAPAAEYEALLRDELSMVEELLELEPNAKWPLAAAAFVGQLLLRATGEEGGEGARAVKARLEQLQAIDKMRARYYADQLDAAPRAES